MKLHGITDQGFRRIAQKFHKYALQLIRQAAEGYGNSQESVYYFDDGAVIVSLPQGTASFDIQGNPIDSESYWEVLQATYELPEEERLSWESLTSEDSEWLQYLKDMIASKLYV